MRLKKVVIGLLGIVVIAAAGFVAFAWKPEIDPIAPPQRATFNQQLINQGAMLAAVGNCIACHTQPGNQAFAGGLALPTPFGTIYSTNITPDPETGIGAWSETAFSRAMREGVARDGSHLYPAFPFDHYTLVTDEDNRALYAYLMTRKPVKYMPPDNELPFPLNNRILLAGWKALFLQEGPYENDDAQSAEWNRGAYLTQGLGHCGSCHTPRNSLGAEKADLALSGGQAEGWSAFALDENSSSPIPWTRDSLYTYLRQGWHQDHGVASGPMAEVTGNLGRLPDADVKAISTYVASLMGEPAADRVQAAERIRQEIADAPRMAKASTTNNQGAAIFQATCAACHDGSRKPPFDGFDLRLSSTLHGPDAQNAINTVLFGLPAASGRPSAIMPGFAATMTDAQLTDLLDYLREDVAGKPRWRNVADLAAATRSGQFHVSVRPSDGIERGPDNIGAQP